MMKVGDIIESAIWITGDESLELRDKYKAAVIQAIDDFCHEHGMHHGPTRWTEKRPGEDRVPQVPGHIQGQRVRLLVAESVVTGPALQISAGSFVANLERKDLLRLRKITKRKFPHYTDRDCDDLIEQLGPEAALETLHQHVH
jgi:hypothetical protein